LLGLHANRGEGFGIPRLALSPEAA
jgi:hypothetical protein